MNNWLKNERYLRRLSDTLFMIATLTRLLGKPPTFRQVQLALGLSSGGMSGRVRALRRMGLITPGDGRSSTLFLTDGPEFWTTIRRQEK